MRLGLDQITGNLLAHVQCLQPAGPGATGS
jgi:hypothetical protein